MTVLEEVALMMTKGEFIAWLKQKKVPILVPHPCRMVHCDCGDLNCHGWRFVRRTQVH